MKVEVISKLQESITKYYTGLSGSDVTTVAWNVMMIQVIIISNYICESFLIISL